ncbi:Trypsin [Vibrio aerogenes CECT 7868]|uniref:Trypsin n=1 Tax=Vibrio aerogenes CECT 7868 TaxID=1216006 RepID=A0A1M5ZNR3_9VIBR|nr:serine protease [Vibrio aerogenes]SHI25927.1 Trypsin [Vibrio aerogenes CECT 7868]
MQLNIKKISACLALSAIAAYPLASAASSDVSKIINGTKSPQGQWPFMTAVVSKGSSAYYGQFCGASYLGGGYVLTAAHCVVDTTASRIEVVIGLNHLSKESSEGVRVGVKSIAVHSGYNSSTMRNDMAILKLKKDVDATPVKLASASEAAALSAGDNMIVMGWGNQSTSGSSFPDALYQVTVPFVEMGTCQSPGDEYDNVSYDNICAGLKQGGKDSCQGDSGGPLVRKVDGVYKQFGVVSWGIGCAQPNAYGVYSNVGYFDSTGWIEKHTPGLDLY